MSKTTTELGLNQRAMSITFLWAMGLLFVSMLVTLLVAVAANDFQPRYLAGGAAVGVILSCFICPMVYGEVADKKFSDLD